MTTERISVRALVEFTHRGEDITPGGSLRDMQEGMLGHKARQAGLPEGWRAEVPLKLTLPLDGGETELVIAGRMDAFLDADVPVIEEIKLWQGEDLPEEPVPAHRLQAVVYGHILCVTGGAERLTIRVAYVDRTGAERRVFDEPMTAPACAEAFEELLGNWLRRRDLLLRHREKRDAALKTLAFPYETWRPGQREMAAQCYTAIRRRKRLFASMPTGTGKSCAALFPALKALGEGLTEKVFYLTARTTQRQGPLDALDRMSSLPLWTVVLDAKERVCPMSPMRCDPEHCPRAKGHFLRDTEVIEALLLRDRWTGEEILAEAEAHALCPFELSLSLCEAADLVICDYNYAFDPGVHLQRIFDRCVPVTLLIDEAHHLEERLRDMLSGTVDGRRAAALRTEVGRRFGRKSPMYRAMTALLRAVDSIPADGQGEGRLETLPEELTGAVENVLSAWPDCLRDGEGIDGMKEFAGDLLRFLRAAGDTVTDHAALWEGGRHPVVTLQALGVGGYFARMTESSRGAVCFSATLEPLADTRTLLGGGEEDACFSVPSPFPPENLLVHRVPVDTRYRRRGSSVRQIADAIAAMVTAHPGRYMAFFPSYAYMEMTAKQLDIPFRAQRQGMTLEERELFILPFRLRTEPVLALCVLGGVFGEGIDLPGDCLDGVAVVGIGLPQVGVFRDSLRDWYAARGMDGFRYAYVLPGMQRVTQAAGRVIRSSSDRGVVLLLDDRYARADIRSLCPAHWRVTDGDPEPALLEFWRRDNDDTGDPL